MSISSGWGVWDKDFELFCSQMDQFKSKIANLSEFSSDLYGEFYRVNRACLESAEKCFQAIKEEKIAEEFVLHVRSKLGPFFYASEMFDYSYRKPQGYPGDFKMMDYIYNDVPCSSSLLGKYYDRFYLDNPYAEAVRSRKDRMVEVLGDIFRTGKSWTVLNIACGPSREVRELFAANHSADYRVDMLALDHDQAALDFSQAQLKGVGTHLKIRLVKADAFKYFRRPEQSGDLGMFNLVYSTGLADYLPDLLLVSMLKFFYLKLNKGGQFILAHKIEEKDPFAPVTPRFICEWRFHKRSNEDLLRALEKAGIKESEIEKEIWDKSGKIKFFVVRKA